MIRSMWMWTAIAAAALVMCLATSTVMVVARRFTARARKSMTGRGPKKAKRSRRAAAEARRAKRRHCNLTRELSTNTAKLLPPQVLLQMIVDRLNGSWLPQAKARRERLITSLASAGRVLVALREANAVLVAETENLAECKRLMIEQGKHYVSAAAQTLPFVTRPPAVWRQNIRFNLDYAMHSTKFKHAFIDNMACYAQEFTMDFGFPQSLMVLNSLLQPRVLRKAAITIVNWASRLIRITTAVNEEEETTTMEFELIPRRDTTSIPK